MISYIVHRRPNFYITLAITAARKVYNLFRNLFLYHYGKFNIDISITEKLLLNINMKKLNNDFKLNEVVHFV